MGSGGSVDRVHADRTPVRSSPRPQVQHACAPCEAQRELPVQHKARLGDSLQARARGVVQTKCKACEAEGGGGSEATAEQGVRDASLPLPFADVIQASFGHHDISDVRVAIGGSAREANDEMSSVGYTFGDRIGFRDAPDLRLAAHEAAHVIHQRAGVVGARGDRWEAHAEQVADRVTQGQSAEALLDDVTGGASLQTTGTRAVQFDPPTWESKSEFAQRVRTLAATRLTQNIAVLGQWATYVRGMSGFQLRAQLLTGVATEYAAVAAPTPGGRQRYEWWAGTHNRAEREFEGSQLDVDATYYNRTSSFFGYLDSVTSGYQTSASVADNLSALANNREANHQSTYVAPDPRYAEYAPTMARIRNHRIGGCQACHEINLAWQRTADRWGSPLPRGDIWNSFGHGAIGLRAPTMTPGSGRIDPALIAFFRASADASASDSAPAAPTSAPPAPVQPATLPTTDASASDSAPVTPAPNPFVPTAAAPTAVATPAPRTDLCGTLPDPEDSARIPSLSSWGEASAIVADAVSRINAVLTPLGPRGYRVLGRQNFDALYAMSPESMTSVRDDIIARINDRSAQYATLRTTVQNGDMPYEEMCPIVDELLPSTNWFTASQARDDVHAWQRREMILTAIELSLLAFTLMVPPAAVVTVPAGVALGVARTSLGFTQRRQGTQWSQAIGSGIISPDQQAQAPTLATRGRNNIIGGMVGTLMSGYGTFQMARQVIAMAQIRQQIFNALFRGGEFRFWIQEFEFYISNGRMLVLNANGEVIGFGFMRNGEFFLVETVPFSPQSWEAAWANASSSANAGGGMSTAMVPYQPGASAIVPYGSGAPNPLAPFAGPLITPPSLPLASSGLGAPLVVRAPGSLFDLTGSATSTGPIVLGGSNTTGPIILGGNTTTGSPLVLGGTNTTGNPLVLGSNATPAPLVLGGNTTAGPLVLGGNTTSGLIPAPNQVDLLAGTNYYQSLVTPQLTAMRTGIYTGTQSVVRTSAQLSNADLALSLNSQLQRVSTNQVDSIVNSFPGLENRARLVLARASGFASMDSFIKLREAIPAGRKLFIPGRGSLADNVAYTFDPKKNPNVAGQPPTHPAVVATTTTIDANTVIILDEVMLARIQSDTTVSTAIASTHPLLLQPRGFSSGINLFNSGSPAVITARVSAVLARANVIETAGAGTVTFEQAITRALDESTAAALNAVNPSFAGMVTPVDPASVIPANATAIADQLNGAAGITEAQIEAALLGVAESERGLMREILAQQSFVFSPRRIANELASQQVRIVADAAQHGIAADQIYYFIARPAKSYGMVAMAHREATHTPLTRYLDRISDVRALGANTMVVVLDDVGGSGMSLMDHAFTPIESSGYAGRVYISPMISTNDSTDLFTNASSGLVNTRPNTIYQPGNQMTALRSSSFYQGLTVAQRQRVEALINHRGFGENGLSVAFPYMAPDNNNRFFGWQLALRFILNQNRTASKTVIPWVAP